MNAIYCRVSTEEQAKSGYSLADQIRSCRTKLYQLGFNDIHEYIDDGYSGEFLDRPALEKLRNDIRAGLITNICVLDPDRLSRNLTNTLLIADEIQTAEVNLIFVTAEYDSSPEGKLFFSIRGAVAAFEKAKTRERTMRGKKSKALSGKIVIKRPIYGYDWAQKVSNYTINNDEAKIVGDIYNMCIKKKMGLMRIANELNSRGLKNKRGNNFTIKNIYRILTEEVYQGTYYEFKEQWEKTGQKTYRVTKNSEEQWIGVPVPAIVTAADQQAAQIQLSKNSVNAKRNRHFDYLLTGILKCGICGKGMTAVSYERGDKRLKYYMCYGKRVLKICPDSAYIPVDEIETAVWDYITRIAEGKELMPQQISTQTFDKQGEIIELSNKESELKKQKDNITNFILENLIDPEKARKRLQELNREISSIASSINELKTIEKAQKKELPIIRMSDVMAAKTIKQKHDLLQAWGIKVIVYKPKKQKTQIKFKFS